MVNEHNGVESHDHGANTKSNKGPAPSFTAPVGFCGVLPGNLTYVCAEAVDGPMEQVRKGKGVAGLREWAGENLSTDTVASGYCRIDVDHYGRVGRFVLLSHNEVPEPWRYLSLAGLPCSCLNDVITRFKTSEIIDLYAFLNQSWAHALYHDRASGILGELYGIGAQDPAMGDAANNPENGEGTNTACVDCL